jgi:hypothetical protein
MQAVRDRYAPNGALPIIESHRMALEAVVKKECDAGVARHEYFKNEKRVRLRRLDEYEVPPDVYVARAGLDPAIVGAFRQSLLSLLDEAILGNLPLQPLARFLPVSDDDMEYKQIRSALTNEILRFKSDPGGK